MRKSAVKNTKKEILAKRTAKKTKAAGYVDSLLELHKLQGVLLMHLGREVR